MRPVDACKFDPFSSGIHSHHSSSNLTCLARHEIHFCIQSESGNNFFYDNWVIHGIRPRLPQYTSGLYEVGPAQGQGPSASVQCTRCDSHPAGGNRRCICFSAFCRRKKRVSDRHRGFEQPFGCLIVKQACNTKLTAQKKTNAMLVN